MTDRLIRSLARRPTDKQPTLRWMTVDTTELCARASGIHQLAPLATIAFSRALTGGALLAALAKSERNINLQISGNGVLGSLFVDAAPSGTLRGYITRNPEAKPPTAANGRPLVGPAFGDGGFVNVLRADASNNYFRGTVAIKTGEIDADIAEYLASSDQVESVIALDVVLDQGKVVRAGGVLLQVLPGDEAPSLDTERTRLQTGVFFETLRDAGEAWPEAMTKLLALERSTLEESEIKWSCQCSENRVMAALMAAGIDELNDIIAKEGKAEMLCDFCRKEYVFDREQLVKLRDLAVSAALSHKDKADHGDN